VSQHAAAPSGGRVTITVGVTNDGPDTAADVVLTDTLAAKLTFQSASPGCAYTTSTRTVRCTHSSLTSGDSKTWSIVAGYKGKSSTENAVTVRSSTLDPNSTNNSSRISFKLL
jgi:uncharacterized repeat protein (TIGR01451 family)